MNSRQSNQVESDIVPYKTYMFSSVDFAEVIQNKTDMVKALRHFTKRNTRCTYVQFLSDSRNDKGETVYILTIQVLLRDHQTMEQYNKIKNKLHLDNLLSIGKP